MRAMKTTCLALLVTCAAGVAQPLAVLAGASGRRASAGPRALSTERSRQDKPQDVAGAWALTVETSQGTGTPSLTLKQDGEVLTGSYSSTVFGEQQVTGTIKGNAISFGFTGSMEGTTFTVTYTGTVEKDTMKGKVVIGDLGEGTFTGKKKSP